MKKCRKCLFEKSLEDFYRRSDGYYQSVCKECRKSISSDWNRENKDKRKEISKKSYLSNKEYLNKKSNEWKKRNSIRLSELRKSNSNKRQENYLNRKNSDKLYKLTESIRCSIKTSISKMGYTKRSRTYEILGCSFEEFKLYIESKFEHWMNWENYGKYNGEFNFGWDMDHIIPISSSKYESDVIRLNNWRNFQPLCSKINRDIKRDKINWI